MDSAKTPTVFIVDDDPAIRRSTGELLEAAGFEHESFSSAPAFLESYQPERPGCLLVDLSMPEMTGINLVSHLRKAGILIPTLIVSGTGSIPQAVEGMKLGVIDYLEKPTDPAVLLEKVRFALELDVRNRAEADARAPVLRKLASLSAREREVLRSVIAGSSSKQVAAQLGISIKTVENHRSKLLQKTGSHNIADLTRMATEAGFK